MLEGKNMAKLEPKYQYSKKSKNVAGNLAQETGNSLSLLYCTSRIQKKMKSHLIIFMLSWGWAAFLTCSFLVPKVWIWTKKDNWFEIYGYILFSEFFKGNQPVSPMLNWLENKPCSTATHHKKSSTQALVLFVSRLRQFTTRCVSWYKYPYEQHKAFFCSY